MSERICACGGSNSDCAFCYGRGSIPSRDVPNVAPAELCSTTRKQLPKASKGYSLTKPKMQNFKEQLDLKKASIAKKNRNSAKNWERESRKSKSSTRMSKTVESMIEHNHRNKAQRAFSEANTVERIDHTKPYAHAYREKGKYG